MPVIDAHAHWFPQPWIDLLLKDGEANGEIGRASCRERV